MNRYVIDDYTFTTNAMANPMTNGMSILMSQLNILDTLSKLNSTYANSTTYEGT